MSGTAECSVCGKRLQIVAVRGRLRKHICKNGPAYGAIKKGTQKQ